MSKIPLTPLKRILASILAGASCLSILSLLLFNGCAALGLRENISDQYAKYIRCHDLRLDSAMWVCNVKKEPGGESTHAFRKRAKLVLYVKKKGAAPPDDQCVLMESGTPLIVKKVIRYWSLHDVAFGRIYDKYQDSFHDFEFEWTDGNYTRDYSSFAPYFIPCICPEQWKK